MREKHKEGRRRNDEKIWREIEQNRDHKKFWKMIKKHRKRKNNPASEIKEEEWIGHFKELLEGRDNRKGRRAETEEEEEDEMTKELNKEFTMEELNKVIRKLKKNKALGTDGLINEFYKEMILELKEEMLKGLNKIWIKGGIMEEWKEAVIYPIYKRE